MAHHHQGLLIAGLVLMAAAVLVLAIGLHRYKNAADAKKRRAIAGSGGAGLLLGTILLAAAVAVVATRPQVARADSDSVAGSTYSAQAATLDALLDSVFGPEPDQIVRIP